jgi:hypothetical protein
MKFKVFHRANSYTLLGIRYSVQIRTYVRILSGMLEIIIV